MKFYFYYEGINKYGPFTEEDLLQKQLSDDSLVIDSETNESMRYADFKLKNNCHQTNIIDSATDKQLYLDDNPKPKRSWKSAIKIVIGILVVAAFIVPKFLAYYYKNKAESAVRELMEEKEQIKYKIYKDYGLSFKYPDYMSITKNEMVADRKTLMFSSNEYDCALLVFYCDLDEPYEYPMNIHAAYTELNTNSKQVITNIYPNAHFGEIHSYKEKAVAKAKMDISFDIYKGKSYCFVGDNKACIITYFGIDTNVLNTIDKCINELVID